ncbi:putative quinol monooxygenase [Nioella aestuarii]|uniref:putative quinol monooxygenase n=1 Tax=Nioella aestuarii TaxID=1662864 RepID=UPI003D7FDE4E
MTVILTGHIDVPADRMEQIRAGLIDHIRLTRAEPGCISFDVTEDPEVQGRFNVAEEFTTPEAFEAHQIRARASDWARISEGIARSYTVTGMPI